MGLHLLAEIDTDSSGVYSVPLGAGTYSVVANLSSPGGSEVPPILTPVSHSGATTQDIAFTTSATSQTLSGSVSDATITASFPLLIVTGDPAVVLARVFPDFSGTYLTRLPVGTHTVMLDPNGTEPGLLASAGVDVTVDGSGITGTDDEGVAISSGILNIDPFGSSDMGQVRAAMSDLFEAILSGDTTAFGNLLDSTAVIGGKDRATLLVDWPAEDWWGAEGYRFDRLQAVITQVNADAYTCAIVRGREFEKDSSTGFHTEHNWYPGFGPRPDWTISVVRASSVDPWLVAGNQISFEAAEVEHGMMSMLVASVATNFEWVEFLVDESEGLISDVTVSGTGITDGTLTEEVFTNDSEWRAEVDGQGAGPSPFDATLGSIVDGGSYTFTVGLTAGGSETATLTHNAPSGTLFPTANVVVDSSAGTVRLDWNEISSQLLRPVGSIGVEVVQVGSPDIPVGERDDLPPGTQFTQFQLSNFTNGETYRFEVYYVDAGGAVQAYGMEVLWPPSAP